MAAVLGVLASPEQTLSAVESLRDAGFEQVDVYSPVPSHEIEHAIGKPPSRVRLWTLLGGLVGAALGYLGTIWMAYDSAVMVGGKPYASIPPYTVIAFELTILIGGVLTVLGLITHGLIMTAGRRTGYRPSFSCDEFGCLVRCHYEQIPRVEEILQEAGCTEVRIVEG